MRRITPLVITVLLLLALVAPALLSSMLAQATRPCGTSASWWGQHRCRTSWTVRTTAPEVAAAAPTTLPPTTAAPDTTEPEPPPPVVVDTTPPPTEAPVDTLPPAPAPTEPAAVAAATTSYPAGWSSFAGMTEFSSDVQPTQPGQLIARASIVDFSGNPAVDPNLNGYSGYTLDTFRIQTREGPRASGAAIHLNYGYIEVNAQPGDHADGVQFYGGGGATITSTKILAGGDGATGIFAADNSHGTITLDGDYFGALPGASRPGFLVRINADGADQVVVRNTVFECGAAANADIAIASNLIAEWTNVRCTDGRPIARP